MQTSQTNYTPFSIMSEKKSSRFNTFPDHFLGEDLLPKSSSLVLLGTYDHTPIVQSSTPLQLIATRPQYIALYLSAGHLKKCTQNF